jgi:hypothetical protein
LAPSGELTYLFGSVGLNVVEYMAFGPHELFAHVSDSARDLNGNCRYAILVAMK